MVSKALRDADKIVRKDHIPEGDRTPGRDEVADWIDENAADEWDEWDFKSVAENVPYSRQHVANVVDLYYRPSDALAKSVLEKHESRVGVGDLTERELELYRRGYRDGWEDRGRR